MNALIFVNLIFFNLCASSYAGRPAKVEKSEPPSFHYKKVSHSVFATNIHWDALPQISGVF
jgi:hypothetical protein